METIKSMNHSILSTNTANPFSKLTQSTFNHIGENAGGYIVATIVIATTAYLIGRLNKVASVNNMSDPNRASAVFCRAKSLTHAVMNGNTQDVRSRYLTGENPFLEQNGSSALNLALAKGDPEIVHAIMEWIDSTGKNPLYRLAQQGDTQKVAALLSMNLPPSAIDRATINGFTPLHAAAQTWKEGVSVLAEMAKTSDREIILAFSDSNRWFNLTSRSDPLSIIQDDKHIAGQHLSEMHEVDLPQIGKSITHVHIHPDSGKDKLISLLVDQDVRQGADCNASKHYQSQYFDMSKLLPSGDDVFQYGKLQKRFTDDPAFSMKAAIVSSSGITWVDASAIRLPSDVDKFKQHTAATLKQMDQDWWQTYTFWSHEKLFNKINEGNVRIRFEPH